MSNKKAFKKFLKRRAAKAEALKGQTQGSTATAQQPKLSPAPVLGSGRVTSPPEPFTGCKARVLSPGEVDFGEVHRHAYWGLQVQPESAVPAALHKRLAKAMEDLRANGTFHFDGSLTHPYFTPHLLRGRPRHTEKPFYPYSLIK